MSFQMHLLQIRGWFLLISPNLRQYLFVVQMGVIMIQDETPFALDTQSEKFDLFWLLASGLIHGHWFIWYVISCCGLSYTLLSEIIGFGLLYILHLFKSPNYCF